MYDYKIGTLSSSLAKQEGFRFAIVEGGADYWEGDHSALTNFGHLKNLKIFERKS